MLRLLLLLYWTVAPGHAWAGESRVQVYDAAGRAAGLSNEALREVFFMRLTTWPNGSPIHVMVLPENHPLHIRFAKEVLGVYPFQLRSAWDRLIYSGTGLAPTVVENMDEMRRKLEAMPGSIGYIEKNEKN